MAKLPQGLDPERHAELGRRSVEPWFRRVFLTLLVAGLIAALANAFGQRAESSTATGPSARLDVRAPTRVRGGLLFQTRIRITALRDIQHPRLVLDQGWLDGLQINTIEPSATTETSRDGRLVLSYDQSMSPGDTSVVYIQYQVNPTSVGKTVNRIELDDAETPLVMVSRTLRRLP